MRTSTAGSATAILKQSHELSGARQWLARTVSVAGHPFLLMPLLTAIVAFDVLPPDRALRIVLVALGVVILPAAFYTISRVRQGTWGDLDVSDKRHRGQFYGILLPLLLIVTIIAAATNVPPVLFLGAASITLLAALAFAVNTRIKVSMHTGFAVFVTLALMVISPWMALAAFVLTIAVGWSRVALARHTTGEVVLGGSLGLAVGGMLASAIQFIN